MNIPIKDNSEKATKVAVHRVAPIWAMSDEELIKALDLKNVVLDYHYRVEDEYHRVDDIYDDDLGEYVAELLYDYCHQPEYDMYRERADKIIASIREDIVSEIYRLDDEAKDYAETVEDGVKGEY